MTALYGTKWTTGFGAAVDPSGVWQEMLSGLTREQILTGLAHCKENLDWPPSLPEFKKLAANLERFPSVDTIFGAITNELKKHQHRRVWSGYHPAVYWVYQQIGSFDAGRKTDDELRRCVQSHWVEAEKIYRAGGLVVPEDHRIEAQEIEQPKKASEKVAEQHVNRLKSLFT